MVSLDEKRQELRRIGKSKETAGIQSPPTKNSCMEQFELMKVLDNYLDAVAQALEDSDPDEVHQPSRTK